MFTELKKNVTPNMKVSRGFCFITMFGYYQLSLKKNPIYIVLLCILLYICFMDNVFVNKWSSQLKKGTLSFIVLNVLKDSEYYGYELIEKVKHDTKIEIAEGTFYPLMNRLKKDGFVESNWVEQKSGIPRKYYKLTKQGEVILVKMKDYWISMSTTIQKLF